MSNVLADKPVATTGVIGAIATGVEAYAEHRGWIPAQAAPLVIGATVAVLATIAHELVAPWRKVKHIVEDGLHITDADFGRFEAVLEQYGLQLVTKELPQSGGYLQQLAEHGPDMSGGVDAIPDGMSAGAPQHAAPEPDPLNMHTDATQTGV